MADPSVIAAAVAAAAAEDGEGWEMGDKKVKNTLPLYGNKDSMNLNSMVLTNIVGSPYFKEDLYELKTFHEVVDEIYYRVSGGGRAREPASPARVPAGQPLGAMGEEQPQTGWPSWDVRRGKFARHGRMHVSFCAYICVCVCVCVWSDYKVFYHCVRFISPRNRYSIFLSTHNSLVLHPAGLSNLSLPLSPLL